MMERIKKTLKKLGLYSEPLIDSAEHKVLKLQNDDFKEMVEDLQAEKRNGGAKSWEALLVEHDYDEEPQKSAEHLGT